MIYCVWYPSGGFGNFINAILTLHGKNFVRPKKNLEFSTTGDSHYLDLVTPKYFRESWQGGIEFLNNKNYCVLIDNGIANESDKFKSVFPNATVIKICYSKFSWPVIARTSIEKTMQRNIKEVLSINEWDTNEPWAKREKYFLYLRDHPHQYNWQAEDDNSIDIGKIYNEYSECHTVLNSIVNVEDFHNMWSKWREANSEYINPVITARNLLSDVLSKKSKDLTQIQDIWTQAIVYYYIWITFGIEVPHNDYSNWFTNTQDIVIMLKEHGVDI